MEFNGLGCSSMKRSYCDLFFKKAVQRIIVLAIKGFDWQKTIRKNIDTLVLIRLFFVLANICNFVS